MSDQIPKTRQVEHHMIVAALALILMSSQFGCGTVATTSAAEELPAGVPADGAAAAPAEMEAAAGDGEIRERGSRGWIPRETRCREIELANANMPGFPIHVLSETPPNRRVGTPLGAHFGDVEIANYHMRFERAVIQNGKFICQYRMGPRNGSTTRTQMLAGHIPFLGSFTAYQCTPGSGFYVAQSGTATCTSSNSAACRAICVRPY
jgi:hypothetical protein